MNGFLLIDKEKGMTSFDVVSFLKKELGTKKIGHTGTLDPMTTGLLVIAIGRATKFIPIISDNKVKKYKATITFGEHRDSFDSEGNIINKGEIKEVTKKKAEEVLATFLGKQTQTPPIFSAKQVNGRRLDDYARNGEEVDIKKQDIEIFDIKLVKLTNKTLEFEATVSKGTYIRSLVVDISEKLDNLGYMSFLERTKTDGYDVSDSKKLGDITKDDIIPLIKVAKEKYPTYQIEGIEAKIVKNGGKLRKLNGLEYPCIFIDKETQTPLAIYDYFKEETKSIFVF